MWIDGWENGSNHTVLNSVISAQTPTVFPHQHLPNVRNFEAENTCKRTSAALGANGGPVVYLEITSHNFTLLTGDLAAQW